MSPDVTILSVPHAGRRPIDTYLTRLRPNTAAFNAPCVSYCFRDHLQLIIEQSTCRSVSIAIRLAFRAPDY